MNKVAIIPARGGSQGLPRKNILNLCGKPVINWSVDIALESELIDFVVVSTEDEEVKDVIRAFYLMDRNLPKGVELIHRPPELSTSTASIIDVLKHVDSFMGKDEYLIVLLYPTFPCRSLELVNNVIKYALAKGNGSVQVMVEETQNVYWCVNQHKDGRITKVVPNQSFYRRQDIPKVYRLSAAVHTILKSDLYKVDNNGMSEDTYGYYEDNPDLCIDIEDKESFEAAKWYLSNKYWYRKEIIDWKNHV